MCLRYIINDDYVKAYISDGKYYCTNHDGEGLFFVDLDRNIRHQLIGTCDFNVKGITDKSKKAKIRKALTR